MLVNIVNSVYIEQYCSQSLVLFNVLFFIQGDPVSPDTSHASCRSTGWHLATVRISCFHTSSGTRSLKIPSILFTLVYSFHGLQIIVWYKRTVTVANEKKFFKSPHVLLSTSKMGTLFFTSGQWLIGYQHQYFFGN